jgi:hypothetical protein
MTGRAHLHAAAAALALLAGACGGGGELREATERRRVEAAADTAAPPAAPVVDTGGEYRVPAFVQAAAPAAPAAVDTAPAAPEWGTSPRQAGREAARTHTLRGVRAGLNPGFERLVLDFGADPVPPYRIEYTDEPARACGTGDPVPVPGEARLRVLLRTTRAHDDQGHPTVVRHDFDPPTQAIRAVRMVCDFEGQVEIVLGVQERTPFRVLVVPSPNRLTVDVRP